MADVPSATLLRKTDFPLSWQISITNSFLIMGGTCAQFPTFSLQVPGFANFVILVVSFRWVYSLGLCSVRCPAFFSLQLARGAAWWRMGEKVRAVLSLALFLWSTVNDGLC